MNVLGFQLSRIASAFSCLVSGLVIYILWRPDGLVFGNKVRKFVPVCTDYTPPDWIVFSLPDSLWYGALLCLQPSASISQLSLTGRILFVASISSGPLHECLQLIHVLPGTFCSVDLSLYIRH